MVLDMDMVKQRPRLVMALLCVVVGVVVLVGVGVFGWGRESAQPVVDDLDLMAFEDMSAAEALPEPTSDSLVPAPAPALIVYVSGAVVMPDVYRLPAEARVLDAVLAAGGLSEDAASATVNLAAPLSDAQHIHIPRQGEADAPVATLAAAQPAGLLDLNQANAVDLEELPGIGQALAARIIAYRSEHGPFTTVDDLQEVSGIGDALFANLRPLVTVNER